MRENASHKKKKSCLSVDLHHSFNNQATLSPIRLPGSSPCGSSLCCSLQIGWRSFTQIKNTASPRNPCRSPTHWPPHSSSASSILSLSFFPYSFFITPNLSRCSLLEQRSQLLQNFQSPTLVENPCSIIGHTEQRTREQKKLRIKTPILKMINWEISTYNHNHLKPIHLHTSIRTQTATTRVMSLPDSSYITTASS